MPGKLNSEEVVEMHEVTVNKLTGKIFTNLMQCLQMLENKISPDGTDFFCNCSFKGCCELLFV